MVDARSGRHGLSETERFRTSAAALLELDDDYWNDWEYGWLRNEKTRRDSYVYTEKEWAILARMQSNARVFSSFSGYTVAELVAIARQYSADFDEDDEEFILTLNVQKPAGLRRRQILRLVRICRQVTSIGWDPLDDDAAVIEIGSDD